MRDKKKKKHPSCARLSRKKGWVRRRQMLRMQKESEQKLISVIKDETIDIVESKELSDKMNSNISMEVQYQDTKRNIPDMHIEKVAHSGDKNLVVNNTGVLDSNLNQENMPEGRRIVDISFMWNEIHKTFNNHVQGDECKFKDWKLVNSFNLGLLTQLFFKCQKCHHEANIWSEPIKSKEVLGINTAVVAGTITTGISYCQLKELCATMNIPSICEYTYIKSKENIIKYGNVEKTAMTVAIENIKMEDETEKQLALEKNETIIGFP